MSHGCAPTLFRAINVLRTEQRRRPRMRFWNARRALGHTKAAEASVSMTFAQNSNTPFANNARSPRIQRGRDHQHRGRRHRPRPAPNG